MLISKKKLYNILIDFKIIVLLMILFIFFTFTSNHFLNISNMRQVLLNQITLIVVVCGEAMVILGGGIDLSVGSLLALCGATSALLVAGNLFNPLISILIVVFLGAIGGLFNGYITTKFKIDPFIVTLGSMSIFRGLALILTNGRHVPSANAQWFEFIGHGNVLGIPIPIIIAMSIVVFTTVLTQMTKFGRELYAIGGNQDTARLSGVKVNFIKSITYIFSGITVSLAGIMQAARLASYSPMIGQNFELEAILAAVIGGISLLGGRGHILGAIFGVLFVGFLRNGLILLGVDYYYEIIIIGIIFIGAISLDVIGQKKKA